MVKRIICTPQTTAADATWNNPFRWARVVAVDPLSAPTWAFSDASPEPIDGFDTRRCPVRRGLEQPFQRLQLTGTVIVEVDTGHEQYPGPFIPLARLESSGKNGSSQSASSGSSMASGGSLYLLQTPPALYSGLGLGVACGARGAALLFRAGVGKTITAVTITAVFANGDPTSLFGVDGNVICSLTGLALRNITVMLAAGALSQDDAANGAYLRPHPECLALKVSATTSDGSALDIYHSLRS